MWHLWPLRYSLLELKPYVMDWCQQNHHRLPQLRALNECAKALGDADRIFSHFPYFLARSPIVMVKETPYSLELHLN